MHKTLALDWPYQLAFERRLSQDIQAQFRRMGVPRDLQGSTRATQHSVVWLEPANVLAMLDKEAPYEISRFC